MGSINKRPTLLNVWPCDLLMVIANDNVIGNAYRVIEKGILAEVLFILILGNICWLPLKKPYRI